MGIQINGQTDIISAIDGSLTISGADLPTVTNLNATGIVTASGFVGNLTGTASTATAAATAYGLSGSPTLSGITSVSTTNLTVNGNAYPSAGPLSNRNLIINGAMQVAQRGTSGTSGGYETVDRFLNDHGGGGAITQSQQALSSGTPYDEGFRYFWRQTNTTASTAAGRYVRAFQYIEAQNVANSGWNYVSSTSYITLSFWVRSSVAQEFYGEIVTKDGTSQNYPFSTGILAADIWTKVTKTIPGNSSITVTNDNGQGLQIELVPFYGTNFTDSGATVDAWQAFSSSSRVPDMTSTWANTTNATFDITGVQLEVGSVATPFERRSYGQELALCQRYYYRVTRDGVNNNRLTSSGFAYSSTAAIAITPFPVEMRTPPTTVEQSGTANHYQVFNSSGAGVACNAVPSFNVAGKWYGEANFPVASGLVAGNSTYATAANAAAYLGWSAEL